MELDVVSLPAILKSEPSLVARIESTSIITHSKVTLSAVNSVICSGVKEAASLDRHSMSLLRISLRSLPVVMRFWTKRRPRSSSPDEALRPLEKKGSGIHLVRYGSVQWRPNTADKCSLYAESLVCVCSTIMRRTSSTRVIACSSDNAPLASSTATASVPW